jgi:hypothetical protein
MTKTRAAAEPSVIVSSWQGALHARSRLDPHAPLVVESHSDELQ